jgi:hypothetical protein
VLLVDPAVRTFDNPAQQKVQQRNARYNERLQLTRRLGLKYPYLEAGRLALMYPLLDERAIETQGVRKRNRFAWLPKELIGRWTGHGYAVVRSGERRFRHWG